MQKKKPTKHTKILNDHVVLLSRCFISSNRALLALFLLPLNFPILFAYALVSEMRQKILNSVYIEREIHLFGKIYGCILRGVPRDLLVRVSKTAFSGGDKEQHKRECANH